MKRILALLLVLVMLASLCACGGRDAASSAASSVEPAISESSESTPADSAGSPASDEPQEEPASAPASEQESVPSAVESDSAAGDLINCHVEILGAEAFDSAYGTPGIRFYYDFTNTSDRATSSYFSLIASAQQDGNELNGSFAMEEVPEFDYASLDIMPGLTIRCVAEFEYDPEGGSVEFRITDHQEDSVTDTFDPKALPGKPEALSIEPIPDPDWLQGVSDSGTLGEGIDVTISKHEMLDQADSRIIRIYFDLTNNTEEETSFFHEVFYTIMQDGVGLTYTYPKTEVPEDANDMVFIAPGESLTVSKCYALRSDSPVTVVLTDFDGSNTVGAVIPVS